MPNTTRKRALWLIACSTLLFAVLAVPKVAFAKPCDELHFWYYPDSSCTGEVGGRIRDCDGQMHTWGSTTPYYDFARVCCYNEGCWNGGYGCDGLPEFIPCGS